MTPEEILSHPPTVLSDEQRRFYFDNGYLLVESIVPDEWVERLIAITGEMVDRSRSLTAVRRHLRPRAGAHRG